MTLKLCIIIFLLRTTIAVTAENVAPFSVEEVWENSRNDSTFKLKPFWIKGVQKYHDDIIVAFGKFPEPLLQQSKDVVIPFENFLIGLVIASNSNSKLLSKNSAKILTAISQVKLPENTPLGVIKEYYRVVHYLMTTFKEIVNSLSPIIGTKLACSVNDAITDLEYSVRQYMTEFLKGEWKGFKELDYDPIMMRAQTLTNRISSIGEAILSNDELATSNVQHAIQVLSWILDHIMICVYGLSGCSEAVLLLQKSEKPSAHYHACRVSAKGFFSGFSESIAAVAYTDEDNVMPLVSTLVKLTKILNETLNTLLGLVFDVTMTTGQVAQNLSKSISEISNGLFNLL